MNRKLYNDCMEASDHSLHTAEYTFNIASKLMEGTKQPYFPTIASRASDVYVDDVCKSSTVSQCLVIRDMSEAIMRDIEKCMHQSWNK